MTLTVLPVPVPLSQARSTTCSIVGAVGRGQQTVKPLRHVDCATSDVYRHSVSIFKYFLGHCRSCKQRPVKARTLLGVECVTSGYRDATWSIVGAVGRGLCDIGCAYSDVAGRPPGSGNVCCLGHCGRCRQRPAVVQPSGMCNPSSLGPEVLPKSTGDKGTHQGLVVI